MPRGAVEMRVPTTFRHRFIIGPDGVHPLPATVFCPRHKASRDVGECLDCPKLASMGDMSMECMVDTPPGAPLAGQLGREPAMCVAPDLPISKVYGELLRRVDLLPVVESDATLVGVVGRREIDGVSRLHGDRPISSVMRPSRWIAVREDEPLGKVAARMARWRLRHLPVVDACGRLVSVVDDTRLLRAFAPG